jgi:hypothetical protein
MRGRPGLKIGKRGSIRACPSGDKGEGRTMGCKPVLSL